MTIEAMLSTLACVAFLVVQLVARSGCDQTAFLTSPLYPTDHCTQGLVLLFDTRGTDRYAVGCTQPRKDRKRSVGSAWRRWRAWP